MQLNITVDDTYLDDDEFEELIPVMTQAIKAWIGEKKSITLLTPIDETGEQLGLSLNIKSKFKLKDPLNFLHDMAKQHKCEFVIAIISEDSGETEDVCYFGYEEGKPDLFEVASYLGLG